MDLKPVKPRVLGVDGDGSIELFTCGFQREIKSSFNQKFVVDYLISEIDIESFDALAIPGGFEEYDFYKDAYDDRFLDLIRGFKSKDKLIASVCVAALPLGKSGILMDKKGTTYNKKTIRQETLRGFGVHVMNEPIVIDPEYSGHHGTFQLPLMQLCCCWSY